jgi:hypothetical protein
MGGFLNQKDWKEEMLNRVPEWAQLFLAVLVLGGGMLATYTANEVRNHNMANEIYRNSVSINELKGIVRDVPLLTERVTQLYGQNERQIIIFEKFAASVDKLSTVVARLDERMKSLEGSVRGEGR